MAKLARPAPAMVKLTIDGRAVEGPKGMTVLQIARLNAIYIPHLCHHPELQPSGVCRLCMVAVGGEVVLSCLTPVEQGMEVKTKSPEIDKARQVNIEILVANHHLDCRGCPGNRRCALQKLMAYIRIDRKRVRRLRPPKEEQPIERSNPCFDYDPNKCVLCEVCVHTCKEIQHAMHIVGRGPKTRIAFFGDSSICESCGKCVVRCPVGSLFFKEKAALQESA